MSGSPTFTIVLSRPTMNRLMQQTASIRPRRPRPVTGGGTAAAGRDARRGGPGDPRGGGGLRGGEGGPGGRRGGQGGRSGRRTRTRARGQAGIGARARGGAAGGEL